VFTPATFDSKVMNRAVFGEFVLAVLVTQMDVFNRLLDTTPLSGAQFLWALLPAVVLLLLWEAGKLIARRAEAAAQASRPEPPGGRGRGRGASTGAALPPRPRATAEGLRGRGVGTATPPG
jgi:Ca2+-transporting ATPase